MNYVKYIFTTLILVVIGILYEKYKQHNIDDENVKQYNLVREYLLNDSSLAQSKLPLLWIHLDYKINARCWSSFNSRNTRDLNQPYKFLTIKSIVDKCGKSFNVCLIDDDSFSNIIPDWQVNLNIVADPIKSNLRRLAFAKILNNYGGMFVPSSFTCFKNLENVYNQGTVGNCMFVGELMDRDGLGPEDKDSYCPSMRLMGCLKDCEMMGEYIYYLEKLISDDYTDESNFVGNDSLWCLDKIKKNEMTLIPAEMLGSRDSEGKIITLEMLLGNTYIDISNDAVGLYIPDDDILRRTAYKWFARLSAGQAISSNTTIGKYLTLSLV